MKPTQLFLTIYISFCAVLSFGQTSVEFFNKGIDKSKKKDYKNAILDFSKAIELDGKFSEAYYSRGYLKYLIDDYKGSIEDISKSIELGESSSTAFYIRGIAKFSLQMRQSGCIDFTKSSELGNAKATEISKIICQADKLVIFTMSSCNRCKKTITFLKEKKIKYTEYSVDNKDNANIMYLALNLDGSFSKTVTTPVIMLKGKTYNDIKDLDSFLESLAN